MPNYTQGSTRVVLQQPDLTNFQGNGSVVLDSRRTRPLWFDGRFMAARDLEREQNYFLQREADLGQAAGFDVMNGLLVDQAVVNGRPDAQTVVIHAGNGITPAGEMVTVSSDLTIALSSIPVEQTLNVQFGLSATPQQQATKRTGLYVIALRPVEFTANPITAYPTTVQGPRSTHDGDIVEATAVVMLPYPNPASNFAASLQQAAIARQIFLTGNPTALPDSVLPLALVSLNQGAIGWLDAYLVRRDTGPQYTGVRFGLTDPATQQAFLMQYDMQLQAAVAARQASGMKANIAATDYFQALPAGGRFPLDAIDTGAFSQVFFPQEMDVRLSIIPSEELPALLEDSMSLPPIDLTLPAGSYSNMSVLRIRSRAARDFRLVEEIPATNSAKPDFAASPRQPLALPTAPAISGRRYFLNGAAHCQQRMGDRHWQPDIRFLSAAAQRPGVCHLRDAFESDGDFFRGPIGRRASGDFHGESHTRLRHGQRGIRGWPHHPRRRHIERRRRVVLDIFPIRGRSLHHSRLRRRRNQCGK